MIVFNHLGFLPYHEQIRTVWEPAVKSCIVTNIGVCKVSMLSNLLTDTLLLLFMLAGLLRLRRGGGGTYGLWRLLWKQVNIGGSRWLCYWPTDTFDVHEGVVWFVVAAVAELPPTVSLASFMYPSNILFFLLISILHRRCSCSCL